MNKHFYYTLTPEELREIIIEGTAQAFENFQNEKGTSGDEMVYVSRKEACNLLKVSKVTLYNWDKKGILKARKIGTRVLYTMEDIKAKLNQEEK